MKHPKKFQSHIFGRALNQRIKMLTKIVALFALGYFAAPALALTCNTG